MKSQTVLLLVMLACGCSPTRDRADDSDGAAGESQQRKESPAPAKTPEELVTRCKAAFASGDVTAIKGMVHWECAEDLRDTMLALNLSTRAAGDATITKASLRPPAENDRVRAAGCSLQPTHILEYTSQDNDGRGFKSTYAFIVQLKGRYYFYLCVPQKGK